MFKIILFVFLLIVNPVGINQGFANNHQTKPDSLRSLLPGKGNPEHVDILNKLASWYAPISFDSSIMYSAQAMRLATQEGYVREIGIARYNAGNAYYYKMDFRNALISYLSAQSILEECLCYNELGNLSLMLGHINFFIMRGDKAVLYYKNALKNYNAAGDINSSAEVLHDLTISYWRDGPMDSALYYGNKLLTFAEVQKKRFLEATALINIGMIYVDKKSVTYNFKALKLANELNDSRLIGIIYNNIASIYDQSSPLFEKQGNLKLSRYYYNLAQEAAQKADYHILLAMILQSLADIDLSEGKYEDAASNLYRCETLLTEYVKYPELQPSPVGYYAFGKIFESYLVLRTKNSMFVSRFKLAIKNGNYEDALTYQRLQFESADALRAVQQGRQLEMIMAEAEAEKTDLKIRALSKDVELNQLRLYRSRFILGGIAALVVIISLFLLLFFQRKKLRAEKRTVIMEQRLLRAQMNPHFLFNSLASIQNYIINEKPDEASLYLSRFSQLVRNVFDNSLEEFVTIENEISAISNYLELQKARYNNKFEFSLIIDPLIDQQTISIPPMLAQPFIENSIEHGIKHRDTPGHISIRFSLDGQFILFEVDDDGVGRKKAEEIEHMYHSQHRSMSTTITRDRLFTLNRKLKNKIKIEIIDLEDKSGSACGTRVTFRIPYILN